MIAAVTGGIAPTPVRVAGAGVALRCLVWGRSGDPTALLVHGNGAHAHWWTPLVRALVPGWRLVVPDLRGHGESGWAEPPRYRMADYGADLDAVVAALAPERLALVGHSMGGRIATWWSAAHADRVTRLAVVDSRFTAIRRDEAVAFRGRVQGQREGRGYPTRAAAEAAFRFVPDEPGVADAIVRLLARTGVRRRGPRDFAYRFDRAVLALDGDGAGDLTAALPRLRCPVLVLGGARSWVLQPAERAAVAAALRDGAVRVFPGGHHVLLADPAGVGAALRTFLDARLPPARGDG